MSKRTKIIMHILALGIAGMIVGYFVLGRRTPVSKVSVPTAQQAPDVALKGMGGREVRISDFRGKPVAVSIWASWCSLCKDELLNFVLAQREFSARGRGDILFIVVNRGEPLEQVQKVSQELGMSSSTLMLLDNDDSFYQQINGFAMPETLFIDQNGMILEHRRGPVTREELRRRIQGLFP